MSGVFSAAATDVLALDATDVFSADTTDVLSAAKVRARPKAERRRPKADVKRDFGLGAFRRPAQNHARRPKADVVKVRPGLTDERPDWLGLAHGPTQISTFREVFRESQRDFGLSGLQSGSYSILSRLLGDPRPSPKTDFPQKAYGSKQPSGDFPDFGQM